MGSSRCFSRLRRASPDARWDFNWAGGSGASHPFQRPRPMSALCFSRHTPSKFINPATLAEASFENIVWSPVWQPLAFLFAKQLDKSSGTL